MGRSLSAGRNSWALVVSIGFASLLACGARTGQSPVDESTDSESDSETTDTLSTTETDSESDSDGGPRLGSCENPYLLPFQNTTIRGRLLGRGELEGWCSETSGLEDVYVVTANYDVDIVLENRPESELDALIHVYEGDCTGEARVCAKSVLPGEGHYFYAEAGKTYTIVIDSPARTDASYAFDVWFGYPALEHCRIHETSINQSPGGYFFWENQLPAGQGHVDGPCGGPGTENMFAVNVDYPGYMAAFANGNVSLDVRNDCGGAHSLVCTENEGIVEVYFDSPGTYYLAVDHEDVTANPSYTLEAFFE